MIGLLLLAVGAALAEAIRVVFLARLPGHPDPLLGMVVLLGLLRAEPAGAVAGLFLGLLRDVSYGNPLGLDAVPLCLVGWLAGVFRRNVYRDALITQALAVFLAGLVDGIAGYLLVRPGEAGGLPMYLARVVMPSAAGTALTVPLAWHLISPRVRRFEGDETKKIRRRRRTA